MVTLFALVWRFFVLFCFWLFGLVFVVVCLFAGVRVGNKACILEVSTHARLTRFFLKGVCSGPLSLGKDL